MLTNYSFITNIFKNRKSNNLMDHNHILESVPTLCYTPKEIVAVTMRHHNSLGVIMANQWYELLSVRDEIMMIYGVFNRGILT